MNKGSDGTLRHAFLGLATLVASVVGTATTAEAAYTFDAGGNTYTITGFNESAGRCIGQGRRHGRGGGDGLVSTLLPGDRG